eukprot:CAMPEP_0184353690 /NCGR_PEP_ID=MMETSP1089-20130417/81210_1 /TAXON_ID=38269 ORGANISM="Gloeochaete wittrockiana, Strain SAG46.84" /NCGR_SAMPLE_ID=MMETSP1089 /ASSEMBLY_ACC=CAM_ASM_000445 /LENGTH=890 /DNA_ID=CAMNT_0026689255 /DNA_START=58 /DNA_END=2729 /DNA_ORIENTATION=-
MAFQTPRLKALKVVSAESSQINGRIYCCIRIRPRENNTSQTSLSWDTHSGQLRLSLPGQLTLRYQVDSVLDEKSTQSTVYDTLARSLVEDFMQGYNATILAYGPSGTGKTYTLLGKSNVPQDEEAGLIPRTASQIFAETVANSQYTYQIQLQQFAICNENIVDLLSDSDNGKLEIRESPSEGGFFVQNLSSNLVTNAKAAMTLIEQGYARRSNASHVILLIQMQRKDKATDTSSGSAVPGRVTTYARLCIVDLAGSDSFKRSIDETKGSSASANMEDVKSVSLSLSTLGNVVAALSENQNFKPYRDSKLTMFLKPQLEGNSRMTVLATISSLSADASETHSVLEFTNRAIKIKTLAVRNVFADTSTFPDGQQAPDSAVTRSIPKPPSFSLKRKDDGGTKKNNSPLALNKASSFSGLRKPQPSPRLVPTSRSTDAIDIRRTVGVGTEAWSGDNASSRQAVDSFGPLEKKLLERELVDCKKELAACKKINAEQQQVVGDANRKANKAMEEAALLLDKVNQQDKIILVLRDQVDKVRKTTEQMDQPKKPLMASAVKRPLAEVQSSSPAISEIRARLCGIENGLRQVRCGDAKVPPVVSSRPSSPSSPSPSPSPPWSTDASPPRALGQKKGKSSKGLQDPQGLRAELASSQAYIEDLKNLLVNQGDEILQLRAENQAAVLEAQGQMRRLEAEVAQLRYSREQLLAFPGNGNGNGQPDSPMAAVVASQKPSSPSLLTTPLLSLKLADARATIDEAWHALEHAGDSLSLKEQIAERDTQLSKVRERADQLFIDLNTIRAMYVSKRTRRSRSGRSIIRKSISFKDPLLALTAARSPSSPLSLSSTAKKQINPLSAAPATATALPWMPLPLEDASQSEQYVSRSLHFASDEAEGASST